ncbi:NADH oxidoreductase hcr [Serratia plymuthica]|uniref:NADH oxidoreductase hcr n=1 Tax=Serratia plymuthica TaxID=82996 RepID=A0A2X4UTA9_SERPL|nr:NADH oxidoreductase hcr [Serratia plymuthica]
MTQPTPLCPNRMQVHSIRQETADVWTLNLICDVFYPYQAGQFALVSIRNTEETLRAYTLSSSPGQSRFLSISVRCLPDGAGSRWLTQEVKPVTPCGCPMRRESSVANGTRPIVT